MVPGQLNKPPGHVYELEGLLNEPLVMQYKPPAGLYKPLGPVLELPLVMWLVQIIGLASLPSFAVKLERALELFELFYVKSVNITF